MRKIAALALAFSLALAAPANAAPALLVNGSSVGGFSPAVTFDSTGATLLVACANGDAGQGSGKTVTDNKGNTWTRLKYDVLGGLQNELWYSIPTTVGASTTITSNANFYNIFAAAFSGTAASSVTDGAVTGGIAAFTTSSQPGSITPSQNGDLLFSCLGVVPGPTGTLAIDSGFTIIDSRTVDTNSAAGGDAYFVQSTAAAINPTWTTWSSAASASNMQAFKASGGGGATTVPLRGLMGVGQ